MLPVYSSKNFSQFVHNSLPFKANTEQTEAIQKISEFIFSGSERDVFILKGYAGTGKTNIIAAITRALPDIKWKSVLLAPTGRAAKVMGNYSQKQALTIHKKIFKKETGADGSVRFYPAENLHKNTLFIVDEASMISASNDNDSLFGSLLENLFEYVYSGQNCKLILAGDTAQLPPVGSELSPALNLSFLKTSFHLSIHTFELTQVVRQKLESGILHNATNIRNNLLAQKFTFPRLVKGNDTIRLSGEDLEDTLNTCINKYGEDNVIIITRSNKRCNLFNQSFRNCIKLFEEDICCGDQIMIVKNNYYWLNEKENDTGFIANGDSAEITKITKREEQYGFNFCDCVIRLNEVDLTVKLITDCLYTDSPALNQNQNAQLYTNVLADLENEPSKSVRANYLKNSPYLNALQVKFAYAITCHKSQGGQWPVVIIDQGYLQEQDINREYGRWLYTALTRATEKVYLVNFNQAFFDE